jgi:hypothetical protein
MRPFLFIDSLNFTPYMSAENDIYDRVIRLGNLPLALEQDLFFNVCKRVQQSSRFANIYRVPRPVFICGVYVPCKIGGFNLEGERRDIFKITLENDNEFYLVKTDASPFWIPPKSERQGMGRMFGD